MVKRILGGIFVVPHFFSRDCPHSFSDVVLRLGHYPFRGRVSCFFSQMSSAPPNDYLFPDLDPNNFLGFARRLSGMTFPYQPFYPFLLYSRSLFSSLFLFLPLLP